MKGRGSVSFPFGSPFCASIHPRPPPDRLLRMSSRIIDDDFKFWSYSGQAFLVVVVVVFFFFDEKLLNWTLFFLFLLRAPSHFITELQYLVSQALDCIGHENGLYRREVTRAKCVWYLVHVLLADGSRMGKIAIMQYINCCARHHVKTFYSPS